MYIQMIRLCVFLIIYIIPYFTQAQERFSIGGTIIDQSNGEPLIGATIEVKEKKQGVISNNYGFFSLRLAKGNYTLEASYLGFKTQSVSITLKKINRSIFN